MIKFSLCIEPVFPEMDFYDRIAAAADLGFSAIEFWDPSGKDIPRIARLAAQHDLTISICCLLDPWNKRMNAPIDVVMDNIRRSLQVASELGCPSLIALSGDSDPHEASQKNILIDNLKRAAEFASQADITINLEALNSLVDHPGYYLDSSTLGFEIIKAVNSSYVRLLYDVYHMQVMEGNLIDNITRNISWIGHFHSAGVPGRHELFSGEIGYPNILKAIEAAGYTHFFGLEYWPSYDHYRSLVDVLRYLAE